MNLRPARPGSNALLFGLILIVNSSALSSERVSYPRGQDTIEVSISDEWLLVDGWSHPDPDALKVALEGSVRGVTVVKIVPLLVNRYAIRLEGFKRGQASLIERP